MDKDLINQKQRTELQNRAIHLYLTWVAQELANQGQTMQDVVKKINKVEITPTMQNVKEIIWREIQKAMFKKDSTTFLTKHEVDEVYKVMSMWLSKNFEISLPFPNDDDIAPLK
jgi:6-pyruvoyl-tetrahydropterin synthase